MWIKIFSKTLILFDVKSRENSIILCETVCKSGKLAKKCTVNPVDELLFPIRDALCTDPDQSVYNRQTSCELIVSSMIDYNFVYSKYLCGNLYKTDVYAQLIGGHTRGTSTILLLQQIRFKVPSHKSCNSTHFVHPFHNIAELITTAVK